MDNSTRKKIVERKFSLGSWVQFAEPGIAEIMAQNDFDWIAVDMEHTDISLFQFSNIARAMGEHGPVPFVRVRENDTLAIRQVLDAGALGVFVPLVNDAEEAARAVAAAKFPPRGVRGFAYYRANRYGLTFSDYADGANDAISVIIMIETKKAVENIDSILAVEGVDGIFVGPYDLSGSYGVVGQTDHPRVKEALERVVAAAENAGKAAGLHVVLPSEEEIIRAVAGGFTLIAVGMDTVFLSRSVKAAYEITRKTVMKKEGRNG